MVSVPKYGALQSIACMMFARVCIRIKIYEIYFSIKLELILNYDLNKMSMSAIYKNSIDKIMFIYLILNVKMSNL